MFVVLAACALATGCASTYPDWQSASDALAAKYADAEVAVEAAMDPEWLDADALVFDAALRFCVLHDVDWQGWTLADVIKDLRGTTGINIVCNQRLAALAPDTSERLALEFSTVTAKAALQAVVSSLHLVYLLTDGVVYVATADDVRRHRRVGLRWSASAEAPEETVLPKNTAEIALTDRNLAICETVFRHYMAYQRFHPGVEPCGNYCLRVGAGDPPAGFMQRFAGEHPAVKPASECRDGIDLPLRIESITEISPSLVRVAGGIYRLNRVDGLNSDVVEFRGGTWVVDVLPESR